MALELVTGYWGQQHVTAEQDADLHSGIIGSEPCILNVGEKMRAEAVTVNKIRIFDGVFVGYGRVCVIDEGAYEDVEVENGVSGLLRNDMIVIKYVKDEGTGIEGVSLAVLKGQTGETAVDPVPNNQDIRAGAFESEIPLYRVRLNGLAIEAVEALCDFPMTMNQLREYLENGVTTRNLKIQKNDPYLLLNNTGGGGQQVGLHYYGSEAGKNIFSIYDNTNSKHMMLIRQENMQAVFGGEVRTTGEIHSVRALGYGEVYGGDKAKIFTDAEGGSFQLFSQDGTVRWEMDSYDNKRFRIFAQVNGTYPANFYFHKDGTVSGNFIKNTLNTTDSGYVLDARQGKTLNDKIVNLKSSLTPKVLASKQNPANNTTISFTSSAPLLLVDFSNGNACSSLLIPNDPGDTIHMISLVWSPTTLSRCTFKRTNSGLLVNTVYACGDWASAAHGIVIRSIG